MALTDKLTAIGDAIREKSGKEDKLTLEAMPGEIRALSAEEKIRHAEIPDYVKAEAIEVARKVQSVRQSDSIVFLAMSDFHHCGDQDNTGWQEYTNIGNLHAGMAAKVLAYMLDMDFACHLGDLTFGHNTTTSALLHQQFAQMNGWLDEAYKGLPQFRTVGNHDTGIYSYAAGTEAALETSEYLFSAIGSYCQGAVFGSEKYGYCYRDFEDKKLRVICLNTSEGLTAAGYDAGYECSPAQLLWFAQTLYDVGSKSNWNIIVLSHYPLDYLGTHPASSVVKAYVEGGSTTQNGKTVNFSGHNSARFVAQFHGHTHCFKVAKLNTINTSTNTATEYDAWRVGVPNAGFYRNNHQEGPDKYGLYFEEDITYDKTIGGADDTSFVVNVINPSEEKIYSFCYGAGYDRVIGYAATVYYSITTSMTNVTCDNESLSVEAGVSYNATLTAEDGYELSTVTVTMGGEDVTAAVYADGVVTIPEVTGNVAIKAKATKTVNYTNWAHCALNVDGSIYNDGKGYKDNYSLNSSGEEKTYTGAVLTGFIPWNPGQVIRLAGSVDYTSVSGVGRMAFYDEEHVAIKHGTSTYVDVIEMNTEMDTNGLVDTSVSGVLAFTPSLEGTGSSGFVNRNNAKYIRISAYGKGENMIITINQPIE